MATAVKKSASSPAATTEMVTEPATVSKAVESASAPLAEVQDTVRNVVEKSVVDTRVAYAKAKAAAEEATGALETSCATAAKGILELNAKALEALRVNAEANFDFLKSVIGVKSVSE